MRSGASSSSSSNSSSSSSSESKDSEHAEKQESEQNTDGAEESEETQESGATRATGRRVGVRGVLPEGKGVVQGTRGACSRKEPTENGTESWVVFEDGGKFWLCFSGTRNEKVFGP